MDVSRVPIIQKEIALLCQQAGKPVIIATQMLQSMVTSPVPTRAEVSDVANAILDCADAVMLSAETSIGQHPVRAVRTIRRIAEQTESFGTRYGNELGTNQITALPVATAVVRGASLIAGELKTPLVAVWTESGETPRLLSKHRLDQPIVALAPNDRICRQMALLYGVVPICLKEPGQLNKMLADLDAVLLDRRLASANDQIVVVADSRPDLPGETDVLFIHPVGSAVAATPPSTTG
jgi:pyruvate kinase